MAKWSGGYQACSPPVVQFVLAKSNRKDQLNPALDSVFVNVPGSLFVCLGDLLLGKPV